MDKIKNSQKENSNLNTTYCQIDPPEYIVKGCQSIPIIRDKNEIEKLRKKMKELKY